MGRRKIDIVKIENQRLKSITFNRRVQGLVKKAHELSVLCDTDVMVLLFDPKNRCHMYSSDDPHKLMERYDEAQAFEQSGGPSNRRRNDRYNHQTVIKYNGDDIERFGSAEEVSPDGADSKRRRYDDDSGSELPLPSDHLPPMHSDNYDFHPGVGGNFLDSEPFTLPPLLNVPRIETDPLQLHNHRGSVVSTTVGDELSSALGYHTGPLSASSTYEEHILPSISNTTFFPKPDSHPVFHQSEQPLIPTPISPQRTENDPMVSPAITIRKLKKKKHHREGGNEHSLSPTSPTADEGNLLLQTAPTDHFHALPDFHESFSARFG